MFLFVCFGVVGLLVVLLWVLMRCILLILFNWLGLGGFVFVCLCCCFVAFALRWFVCLCFAVCLCCLIMIWLIMIYNSSD